MPPPEQTPLVVALAGRAAVAGARAGAGPARSSTTARNGAVPVTPRAAARLRVGAASLGLPATVRRPLPVARRITLPPRRQAFAAAAHPLRLVSGSDFTPRAVIHIANGNAS